MSENYIFQTAENDILRITTYGNYDLETKDCIIFVHGFKGFKDWGFVPPLASFFADKGYFVITFNFSHNGIGEDLLNFTELEKFADNTYSREISELSQIITAYKNNYFGKSGNNRVFIVGHSRGGAVSILTAAKRNDIDGLVTWAAISKLDRFTERQKDEWLKTGYLEVINSRTNQMMRLNKILLEDIKNNYNSFLNIKSALSNIKIPYLIIHGEQDLAVPVQEAIQLKGWCDNDLTELIIIPGTGHTFDIKHPFEGSSKSFDLLLESTERFLFKIKKNVLLNKFSEKSTLENLN